MILSIGVKRDKDFQVLKGSFSSELQDGFQRMVRQRCEIDWSSVRGSKASDSAVSDGDNWALATAWAEMCS